MTEDLSPCPSLLFPLQVVPEAKWLKILDKLKESQNYLLKIQTSYGFGEF